MAVLAVDSFRGKMTGGGARANMFSIDMAFPFYASGNSELTSFMCRAASLPGSELGTVEVPFRGRIIKMPGDRTFEPWTITVYNDTNFNVRNSFERWMNGMNTHQENLGLFVDNAGYNTYATNVEVKQLNQIGATVKTYSLKNAFPSGLSNIELSYDQVTQIEEFTVTFQYDYWSNDNTL